MGSVITDTLEVAYTNKPIPPIRLDSTAEDCIAEFRRSTSTHHRFVRCDLVCVMTTRGIPAIFFSTTDNVGLIGLYN